MTVRFLAEGIWKEITAAVKGRRGKAFVAVPYFGKAGCSLLPLEEEDTLVVNASEAAVRSGQTYPQGLRKLLNQGVRLYSLDNLHAKVYVLGSLAFIGSSNASSRSSEGLEEAVVRVRDPRVVRDAREYVQGLCVRLLVHRDLDRLEKLYRPPRIAGSGRRATSSRSSTKPRYFIAQVEEEDEIGEDYMAALAAGEKEAKAKRERKNTVLGSFVRAGKLPYRTGDYVIQVVEVSSGAFWIYPVGKVIYRQVVPGRRGGLTTVHLEFPDRPRRRLHTVSKRLAIGDRGRIKRDCLVGNNEFRKRLLQILG